MNLLKAVTVSIGWLSGSLAGIGAILYAFGYLITRAQQHLLGLDGLSLYDNEHFLQEGAKFFVTTGELVLDALLILVVAGLILAAATLLVFGFLRGLRGVVPTRVKIVWQGTVSKIRSLNERLPWLLAFSGYLVLLVLLLFYLLNYREMFMLPLKISNILYAETFNTAPGAASKSSREGTGDSPSSVACPAPEAPVPAPIAQKQFMDWVRSDCTVILNRYYTSLLYLNLEAAGFLILAWRVTTILRFRAALLLPFIVILVLYTLYLPMAYGVLVRPTRYNHITVQLEAELGSLTPDGLFLLNKTDREFIVWDSVRRQVFWIPTGLVQRAQIWRAEPLFGEGRTNGN